MNARAAFKAVAARRKAPSPAPCAPQHDLLERDIVVVPDWLPVTSLTTARNARGSYPVLNAEGSLVGIVDLGALARRPELHDRLAGQVCTPCTAQLETGNFVLEEGRLVGFRTLRRAS